MKKPPIPEPCLKRVDNQTPYDWFACDKMGVGRTFFDTLVVKGTFALAPGELVAAPEQHPVALVDDHWDHANAPRSSLRHAGEALLGKPSTDVIVTGTARRSEDDPLPTWDVGVAVRRRDEPVIAYHARVHGPRSWRHGDQGWALTEAKPTSAVPIRYELAYGGSYPEGLAVEGEPARPWVVYAPNPSGVGFLDERRLDTSNEYPAPQWELPDGPVTAFNHEVPLCGLGPIARPWSARLGFAGTYDDAWKSTTRAEVESGLPADYAADFDPRFFQCANPALVTPSYLHGDEEIELRGLVPGAASFTFRLPGVPVVARLRDGRGLWHVERMRLDTVHVDLDAARVFLCWRLTLDQRRDLRRAVIVEGGRPRVDAVPRTTSPGAPA